MIDVLTFFSVPPVYSLVAVHLQIITAQFVISGCELHCNDTGLFIVSKFLLDEKWNPLRHRRGPQRDHEAPLGHSGGGHQQSKGGTLRVCVSVHGEEQTWNCCFQQHRRTTSQ